MDINIFIIMTLWGQSGPPMLEGRTGWSWCIKPIHLMHSMVCMVWYGWERYGVVWLRKIRCGIVMHETHSTDALNAINSLHDVGEEEESFRKDKKEKVRTIVVIMLLLCYHVIMLLSWSPLTGTATLTSPVCDHDHTVIVTITVIHQDQNSDQDPEDYETTLWHFNFGNINWNQNWLRILNKQNHSEFGPLPLGESHRNDVQRKGQIFASVWLVLAMPQDDCWENSTA